MTPTRCRLAALLVLLAAAHAPAGSTLLPFKKKDTPPAPSGAEVLALLDGPQRALAGPILDRPTLAARGPKEAFTCHPVHYYWFLDHPDQAVTTWRRIGAKCVSITPRGEGFFGWSDEHGSDLVWHTLHSAPGVRVWYAEGKVRPGPVLPMVPVKAVVALHHAEGKNAQGATIIRHHADLFVQTDSKTAAAFTKMMGQSAPRLAEQGLGQLQLFFSGLSWYLDRHPEQAETLLRTGDAK
jgi:hypothetical protein